MAAAAAATTAGLTDAELMELWEDSVDFEERDRIVAALKERKLFPSEGMTRWEMETGAYPLQDDPEFLQKLLAKREFAESLQTTWEPAEDPCGDGDRFEVTPVQRFVANLMSPRSPYMSALLYHGVGVGKTCAAVQIAEAWLEAYPRDKVFLIAPPTIQQGFYRTIFDSGRARIAVEEGVPNSASGCTGDRYLKLTGTLLERDRSKIERRVNQTIRRRYAVFGYISFANYVRDLLKNIPPGASEERRRTMENDIIRREFSGKLMIVDEAHNLRDMTEAVEDDIDGPGGATDKSDTASGKLLTPYLKKVLGIAEGLKLVLLTATPMYNSYREIVFILNLLLLNDKKAQIAESDVFTTDGRIRAPGGEEILAACARRYVSFMRGENPRSFPIRLWPDDIGAQGAVKLRREAYPLVNPRGGEVPKDEKTFVDHLPLVGIPLIGDTLAASRAFMNALPPGSGGLSSIVLEKLVHAGNFIVPSVAETAGDTLDKYKARTDIGGLGTVFVKETIGGGEVRYRAKEEVGARWLGVDRLRQYSPKFVFLIERLARAEGAVFVYTRFVNAGALPLALALEANGYTPYGRRSGLLVDGIQTSGGRQCAMCPLREEGHMAAAADHDFMPAYYGLITGDSTLSPRNEDIIRAQRDIANKDGGRIKVLIGSQIASEGVDLRFIREVHVLDSWFHLNKTEQILGRAIRFCSHSALSLEKRNTTIYLYAALLLDGGGAGARLGEKESADLYSYRVAFRKAVQVGRVSRVLKVNAIDCNLNRNAIVIQGQDGVQQIDSQRKVRSNVNINDMPFTAVCDWIEKCTYECRPTIAVQPQNADDSTYSEFAARWRESRLKERIRTLFGLQPFYKDEDLLEIFADVPRMSVVELINEIVDNRLFQVRHGDRDGYVRFCNGYYVFQPNMYADIHIPLSIRVAKVPVRRDNYVPRLEEVVEMAADEETGAEDVANVREVVDFAGVWNSIVEWCAQLAERSGSVPVPGIVEEYVNKMAGGDRQLNDKMKFVLETIEWFHTAFHRGENVTSITNFKKALMGFFWDNWFSLENRKLLSRMASTREVDTVIGSDMYRLGRGEVIRFLNPENGQMVYMCDGEPCRASIIDEVERGTVKPVVNIETTGELYGFIVPKNGAQVFKTSEPPAVGKPVAKGAECQIVSNISEHNRKLVRLGRVLQRAGRSDLDLRLVVLVEERRLENATRSCCLLELVCRFMDLERVEGKRWFYGPVMAWYCGHKGLFREDQSTASALAAPKKRGPKPRAAAAATTRGEEAKIEGLEEFM